MTEEELRAYKQELWKRYYYNHREELLKKSAKKYRSLEFKRRIWIWRTEMFLSNPNYYRALRGGYQAKYYMRNGIRKKLEYGDIQLDYELNNTVITNEENFTQHNIEMMKDLNEALSKVRI